MKLLISDFGEYFKKYGITKKQLRENYDGQKSPIEYALEILKLIQAEILKAHDNKVITLKSFYDKISCVYKQSVNILRTEEKDTRKMQALQFEFEVRHMELAYPDLTAFQVFSVNCCEGCDSYHHKLLTIEEAINFAKTTEVRCHPKFDNFCRSLLFVKAKSLESTLIKIQFG